MFGRQTVNKLRIFKIYTVFWTISSRGVISNCREVPLMFRESPPMFQEVPGSCREAPSMCRELPPMCREVPPTFRGFPQGNGTTFHN